MTNNHKCPHCKKDRRYLDEVASDIRDFVDSFDECSVDENDLSILEDAVETALQFDEVKRHPKKTATLERVKCILAEIEGFSEDYENLEPDADDRGDFANEIIELQGNLKKELKYLTEKLHDGMDFFRLQVDVSDDNLDEMK